MTVDEVTELLRFRWRLTDGKLTFNDEKIAAWHHVLKPHDYGRIRARMATTMTTDLHGLIAGIKPPEPVDHERPTHNARGEEYIPWSDPRAQAAFRRGYREATGREWQGDDPTGAR